MKILPLRTLTHTARKIRRCQPYKDRVLAKAFYFMPRNHDIICSSDSEKAVASRNQKCQYFCILTVKFKIRGISQSCSIAQINDLQLPQIGSTATLHKKTIPSHSMYHTKHYMRRNDFTWLSRQKRRRNISLINKGQVGSELREPKGISSFPSP